MLKRAHEFPDSLKIGFMIWLWRFIKHLLSSLFIVFPLLWVVGHQIVRWLVWFIIQRLMSLRSSWVWVSRDIVRPCIKILYEYFAICLLLEIFGSLGAIHKWFRFYVLIVPHYHRSWINWVIQLLLFFVRW